MISKNNILIRSITITAILTSFAMITSYSTDFIKLGFLNSFLSLDLSLIFVIPLIFICGIKWAFISSLILSCFSFINGGISSWIGPLFNLFINTFVVFIIYLIYFKVIRIQNIKIRLLITSLIALMLIILFSCLLNGFIFTPLYVAYFNNDWKLASFIELLKDENKDKFIAFTLGIPNYWLGIFSLYSAFNAIKFSIVLFISYFIVLWIIKNKISQKYFGL